MNLDNGCCQRCLHAFLSAQPWKKSRRRVEAMSKHAQKHEIGTETQSSHTLVSYLLIESGLHLWTVQDLCFRYSGSWT